MTSFCEISFNLKWWFLVISSEHWMKLKKWRPVKHYLQVCRNLWHCNGLNHRITQWLFQSNTICQLGMYISCKTQYLIINLIPGFSRWKRRSQAQKNGINHNRGVLYFCNSLCFSLLQKTIRYNYRACSRLRSRWTWLHYKLFCLFQTTRWFREAAVTYVTERCFKNDSLCG